MPPPTTAIKAPATSFAGALRTIVVADAVMGVDNVLAIGGAATGSILLIVLGLAISVPIIVWGSQLVIRLVDRYPSVVLLGGAVLAWTGYSMVVREPLLASWFEIHPATKLVAAILFFSISLAPWYTARLRPRRSPWSPCCRRVLVWLLGFEMAASVWKLAGRLPARDPVRRIHPRGRDAGWAGCRWRRPGCGCASVSSSAASPSPAADRTLAARIAAQYDRGMRAKLLCCPRPLPVVDGRGACPGRGRRRGLLRPAFRPVSPLSRQYRRGPDVSRRRGRDGDGPVRARQYGGRHSRAGEEAARRALHASQTKLDHC